MAIAFRSTYRALAADSAGRSLFAWLWPLALSAAWLFWVCAMEVPVYASSRSGRLETRAATHRVMAEVAGRVALSALKLGDEVTLGQTLVELDAAVEQRKLQEADAALAGIALRRAALAQQLASERDVLAAQQRAHEATLERRRIAIEAADEQAGYHAQLGQLSAALQAEELVTRPEALGSAHDFASSVLQTRTARAELTEQDVANQHADQTQLARIAALARELSELDAAAIGAHAAVETASAELARRSIRAAAAGRIGSLAPLQIGDVLQHGQAIATIIPQEHVRVVADFAAEDALGRIQAGQPARIVLSGFSLLEFGALSAQVVRVASEAREGLVRVELALDERRSRLPVQHGLPGTVEVRIEATTPWHLLLRSVNPVREQRHAR